MLSHWWIGSLASASLFVAAAGCGSDGGGGETGDGEGACTNAADMAVLTGDGAARSGCEGGVCAGKNVAGLFNKDYTGLTMCAKTEAPTIKRLTPACQQCFVDITTCVPSKCVMILGGEDACGSAAPPTDFAACDKPATPDAKCAACTEKSCQPAFEACSGL